MADARTTGDSTTFNQTLYPNSDKNGCKPRGRKPGKRTDFVSDPAVIARRQKALSRLDAAE
ncbi:hypothetical protein BC374_20215 [Ensifer sp. LC13]|nr:hypothetical protein BBX50_23350 [Ensifer sp. LC11]OCP09078.1 hypothetical protein BC374_20215 [Ensifer sp. LC13]OCP09861.1 hypothetical protein BC362_08990 [Ensifer sp. LC14]OCP31576.1 hypothetical protein BC364_23200 [Ensifer sp. LC499]